MMLCVNMQSATNRWIRSGCLLLGILLVSVSASSSSEMQIQQKRKYVEEWKYVDTTGKAIEIWITADSVIEAFCNQQIGEGEFVFKDGWRNWRPIREVPILWWRECEAPCKDVQYKVGTKVRMKNDSSKKVFTIGKKPSTIPCNQPCPKGCTFLYVDNEIKGTSSFYGLHPENKLIPLVPGEVEVFWWNIITDETTWQDPFGEGAKIRVTIATGEFKSRRYDVGWEGILVKCNKHGHWTVTWLTDENGKSVSDSFASGSAAIDADHFDVIQPAPRDPEEGATIVATKGSKNPRRYNEGWIGTLTSKHATKEKKWMVRWDTDKAGKTVADNWTTRKTDEIGEDHFKTRFLAPSVRDHFGL